VWLYYSLFPPWSVLQIFTSQLHHSNSEQERYFPQANISPFTDFHLPDVHFFYILSTGKLVMSSSKGASAPTPHVSGQSNIPLSLPAHALSIEAVTSELSANLEDGLILQESHHRLSRHGPNELADGPGVQPLKILIRQIANAMILVKRTILPFPAPRFSDSGI
jgi:magnesium-transporting ATPase (P-type)